MKTRTPVCGKIKRRTDNTVVRDGKTIYLSPETGKYYDLGGCSMDSFTVIQNANEAKLQFQSMMKKINRSVNIMIDEVRTKTFRKCAKEFFIEKTRNKERTIKY